MVAIRITTLAAAIWYLQVDKFGSHKYDFSHDVIEALDRNRYVIDLCQKLR